MVHIVVYVYSFLVLSIGMQDVVSKPDLS